MFHPPPAFWPPFSRGKNVKKRVKNRCFSSRGLSLGIEAGQLSAHPPSPPPPSPHPPPPLPPRGRGMAGGVPPPGGSFLAFYLVFKWKLGSKTHFVRGGSETFLHMFPSKTEGFTTQELHQKHGFWPFSLVFDPIKAHKCTVLFLFWSSMGLQNLYFWALSLFGLEFDSLELRVWNWLWSSVQLSIKFLVK